MERTEEQKQKLLKDLWYKRNPSHDRDSNGVDRFWGTVLCVLEDYKVALTLPDVVKPFYCGSDYNHNAGRCKSQCRMCTLEEKKGKQ
jgi:hypothetical protein